MPENKSNDEKFLDPKNVKKRLKPEGYILLYSLFFGFAAAPAAAYIIFHFAGTVPEGYSIVQFYRDVRRDLMSGVWIAWVLVLLPYGMVQFVRIARWAIKATKESMSAS